MIIYDPKTKTVKMDLVDLEHCGFDHDEYKSELFLAGLSDIDPALQWPEFLVVHFAGGAVKMYNPELCKNCGEPKNHHSGRGKFCKNRPSVYEPS